MVDECHKRGIEVYAWVNPYRWSSTGTTSTWNTDFDTEDKSYYEMSNLERLDQIFKAACTLEGLRTGELEDAINNLRRKEKENLKWSAVYPVTNGQAGEAIFEGSAVDCTSYIIDHPELKGKCIIGQLY